MVAWASMASQAVLLLQQGVRSDKASRVLSVFLGALLVSYVSVGVVWARTVRLVVAWVVLVLSLITGLVSLALLDDLGQAPARDGPLARDHHGGDGRTREVLPHRLVRLAAHETVCPRHPRIGQLVAIGLLVGVLGGLAASVDAGFNVRISVTGR